MSSMKVSVAALALLVLPLTAPAQVDSLWSLQIDGPAHQYDEGSRVTVDGTGTIYVAGLLMVSASPPYEEDYAVIKIRPDGDTAWTRLYSAAPGANDQPAAIAVDGSGNVYVSGTSYYPSVPASYTTVKYNSLGSLLWARRYPPVPDTTDFTASAMGLDAAGNVYVTGIRTIPGAWNRKHVVTIKYDPAGALLWTRTYEGNGYYLYGTWEPSAPPHFKYLPNVNLASSMTVDAGGNVIVVGATQPFGYYDSWYPGYDYLTLSYPASGASPPAATAPVAGSPANPRIQLTAPKPPHRCGTRDAIAAAMAAPTAILTRRATQTTWDTTHFRVHYDTTGVHAATHALAERIAEIAEQVWDAEYNVLGWKAPPGDALAGGDDRYDIYIDAMGLTGTLAATAPDGVLGTTGRPSHVQVNVGYYPTPWNDGSLQLVVAHELNHASQLSYSVSFANAWWYENTANFVSEAVFENVDDYYFWYFGDDLVKDPLEYPDTCITTFDGNYEYAGMLWPMFLAEYYAGTLPLEIWRRIDTTDFAGGALANIDAVLQYGYATTLEAALQGYGMWRFFTGIRADTTYHFSESDKLPTSFVLRRHSAYAAAGTDSGYGPYAPGGTSFIVCSNAGGATLDFAFNGQNSSGGNNSLFSAGILGYHAQPPHEFPMTLNGDSDGSRSVSFPGYDSLILVPTATHWTTYEPLLSYSYTVGRTAGQWARTWDNPHSPGIAQPFDDSDFGRCVGRDATGNILISGSSSEDALTYSIATVKYDTAGNETWSDMVDVSPMGSGDVLAVDGTGNVFVGGTTSAGSSSDLDFVTLKYSPSGALLWTRSYAGAAALVDKVLGIAADGLGNCYVTGPVQTAAPPTPDFDMATIRYGADGDTGWIRVFDGPASDRDQPNAVAVDGDNNVIITGWNVVTPPYTDLVTLKYSQQDAQAVSIVSPPGSVTGGSSVIPQVVVKNNGAVPMTFSVRLMIGGFYDQTAAANALLPDSQTTVAFPLWSVTQGAGTYAVLCSTQAVSDFAPANNAASLLVTILPSGTVSVGVSVEAGWNMIANPVVTGADSLLELFPTSTNAYAFGYTCGIGYEQEYVLERGRGYWGKFGAGSSVAIVGGEVVTDTVIVCAGWNLIGGISDTVDVATIASVPPGIRSSPFFGSSGAGYHAVALLLPGKAHWVKTSAAGELHLGSPARRWGSANRHERRLRK